MRVDASQVLSQGGIVTKQGAEASGEAALRAGGAPGGMMAAEEDLSVKPNLMRGFSDLSLEPFAARLAQLGMEVNEDTARSMRDLMTQYPRLSMDEAAFLASNDIKGDESQMRAALSVMSGGEKTSTMIASIITTLESSAGSFPAAGDIHTSQHAGAGSPDVLHVSVDNRAPLSELIAAIVKNAAGLLASVSGSEGESVKVTIQGETAQTQSTEQIIPQPDSNMQTNTEKLIKNPQNILQNLAMAAETQPEKGAAPPAAAALAASEQGEGKTQTATAPPTPAAEPAQNQAANRPAGEPAALPLNVAAGEKNINNGQNVDGRQNAADGQNPPRAEAQQAGGAAMTKAVANLLSQLPQFQGTPQSALDRFSNMLMRVAGDAQQAPNDLQRVAGDPQQTANASQRPAGDAPLPAASNAPMPQTPEYAPAPRDSGAFPLQEGYRQKDVEQLAAQLEKMFTRIDRNDPDAGTRLRQAREELFARLTLVQEEISRASAPVREQLLSQTQRLMDHVRVLNNIDQFAYMQLPVQLREERTTAELYVFKRKGGKKADPDNVNILLSIDLEFMGHWEALLNVKGKDVSLNMEVADEDKKKHFNENTVLLHDMLQEAGFKLVSTTIKISQEETTPLTALTAFDRHIGARAGGRVDFFL